MNGCRLCDGLEPVTEQHFWNKPLIQTPNFVVVPSLGALIAGWVLIVPKQHALAMGALSDSLLAELNILKRQMASLLSEHYKSSVCAFEHGPSYGGSQLGCGVDHAHLHLVPVGFDLSRAVEPYMPPQTQWRPADFLDCRAAFTKGLGYLYLEQPIGYGQIATGADFESQLFRRAIATSIGLADQFHWREYPQLHNIEATIQDADIWSKTLRSCPKEAAA